MNYISLVTAIPNIIILIATLLYITRRFTMDGLLMMIGAVIGLLSSVFNTVIMPWLFGTYGVKWYESYMMLVAGTSVIGGLCFSIGLLLLVQNVLSSKA